MENGGLNNEVIDKRKEKIKAWLKNPYHLIFIIILILGICIRLYYFNLTKSQPIWWDEADYLAYAKNIAGIVPYWTITSQHNSILPYLVAVFFKVGLSEEIVKFLLELIPSIILIFLVYKICLLMYEDKRIALISSFLMAVLWEVLFNSMRFHVDIPALTLGLLAVYIFWQGYEKGEKIFGKINPKFSIPLAVFLVILTYSMRRGYFIFGIFFLLYMVGTRNIKDLIKDKYNWIALGFSVFLFLFIEKFIYITSEVKNVGIYYHGENPINFLPLQVFNSFFISQQGWLNFFLYLFWIGFILILFNVILSFGYIKKARKTNAQADLFVIITICITLALFIFVLRTPGNFGESRWYFPLLLGAFISISRASLTITDFIKSYNKYLAVIVLIGLMIIGGYFQFSQADLIIKNKVSSFEGIKQASFYVKEISSPEDVIVSVAVPQVVYYAERKTVQPDKIANWENSQVPLDKFLEKLKEMPEAKYLFVSLSQVGHPDWMLKLYGVNGQITGWEIPFMDTKADLATNKQDIRQSKVYGDITFELLNVKSDVLIYTIKR